MQYPIICFLSWNFLIFIVGNLILFHRLSYLCMNNRTYAK